MSATVDLNLDSRHAMTLVSALKFNIQQYNKEADQYRHLEGHGSKLAGQMVGIMESELANLAEILSMLEAVLLNSEDTMLIVIGETVSK